jgi:hypothetical protein
MDITNEFNEDEWKTIISAPAMAGVAVAAASPNGPYGFMKEMLSIGMSLQDIVERSSANSLINALIDDVRRRRTRTTAPLKDVTSPEEAKKRALAHLRAVAEILYRKPAVSDAAAEEFKRWLVTIAQRVAEAATEGGFLGIGGELVSDDERAAIRQVAFALGLPATGS